MCRERKREGGGRCLERDDILDVSRESVFGLPSIFEEKCGFRRKAETVGPTVQTFQWRQKNSQGRQLIY